MCEKCNKGKYYITTAIAYTSVTTLIPQKICGSSHTSICYPYNGGSRRGLLATCSSAFSPLLREDILTRLLSVHTSHRLSENNDGYDFVLINEFR